MFYFSMYPKAFILSIVASSNSAPADVDAVFAACWINSPKILFNCVFLSASGTSQMEEEFGLEEPLDLPAVPTDKPVIKVSEDQNKQKHEEQAPRIPVMA